MQIGAGASMPDASALAATRARVDQILARDRTVASAELVEAIRDILAQSHVNLGRH